MTVSGSPGRYTVSVTVQSPDTGCDRYADWWEVLSGDGELLYRRILLHSHVGEQPFTRSGGPVAANAGDTLIVRAHMNTSGYGGVALQGSAAGGFAEVRLDPDFAAAVGRQGPQSSQCAF